ncbi:MAG: HAD-IA family hydrolase [Pseudomonadota bacterium]
MTIPRPSIVLFDMDGTTVRHINPRLLGVLEFADDLIFKMGKLFSRGDAAYDPDNEPKKSKSVLVHRALHKVRRKPVEQIVQPCPGIYAILNLIRAQGIPLGIVSNGLGKGYGDDILEKFHLSQYFKVAIFREDFSKSKPHPDPLLRALKDLKDPLTPDDIVWYIGDRHKDILAALAADKIVPATVVPLAYGLNASVAVLEKSLGEDDIGPENIIMNYHDFARTARDVLGDKGAIAA